MTTARIRAIGTAQDGGIPHAACSCLYCTAAVHADVRPRYIASLALILPGSDAPGDDDNDGGAAAPTVYLVDATPDVRAQLDLLKDVRDDPARATDRDPVDGVFLTHAHIGHYTGLAFFGFEAVSTHQLPTYVTPRMGNFLRENGPWSQLVTLENLSLVEMTIDEPFEVGANESAVTVTAFTVPHREEFSDTVGFSFRGDARTLVYVPDCHPWGRWDPAALVGFLNRLDDADVAILDGCFSNPDELPGRDLSHIGHPFISDTMDLLQQRVDAGKLTVAFTHFNHSNPVLDPDGAFAGEVLRRGFRLLREGDEFDLDVGG